MTFNAKERTKVRVRPLLCPCGPGSRHVFIDKIVDVMERKVYELAASTRGGRIIMSPWLLEELSASYSEEIAALEKSWQYRPDEVERLLKLSRAYERFGDFMRQCGVRVRAFKLYCCAADACLWCTDSHWFERENGYTLCRPLRNRFFYMYGRCMHMVREMPQLRDTLQKMTLDDDFRTLTE